MHTSLKSNQTFEDCVQQFLVLILDEWVSFQYTKLTFFSCLSSSYPSLFLKE